MCRLYALHANEPTKVECSLVHAQNALLTQSISDQRGEAHPDGWGISYYDDVTPTVERRDTAAHVDEHFSLAAERVYAETVVAHVRKATVGGHSLANTHPFVYGRWTFAHNGTLGGFRQIEAQLREETDQDLIERRHGETDSETIFYWLVTRMRRANPGERVPSLGAGALTEVMLEAVRTLDDRSRRTTTNRITRLNFVITDGRTVVASRLRNTLFCVVRPGIHDCEICGIPHVDHVEQDGYRAVVVASEPISEEDWREVPEKSVLCIAEDLETGVHPL